MMDATSEGNRTINLHLIPAGQEVQNVEMSVGDFTARARCRPATPAEIRSLIEELFRQLPESERHALHVRIRSDGMI